MVEKESAQVKKKNNKGKEWGWEKWLKVYRATSIVAEKKHLEDAKDLIPSFLSIFIFLLFPSIAYFGVLIIGCLIALSFSLGIVLLFHKKLIRFVAALISFCGNRLWIVGLVFLIISMALALVVLVFQGKINIGCPPPESSSPTPTITLTTTPILTINVDQIGECVSPYEEELCWFNVTTNENSPIPIANVVYPNEIYAWRIAELMRDKNGIITKTPRRVLIPYFNSERTIDTLLRNLNVVLGWNYVICDDSLQFPCLLKTTKNESYESIAEDYYEVFIESEVIKRLKRANDFEYFVDTQGDGDLRELSSPFTVGTIVYLPTPK